MDTNKKGIQQLWANKNLYMLRWIKNTVVVNLVDPKSLVRNDPVIVK